MRLNGNSSADDVPSLLTVTPLRKNRRCRGFALIVVNPEELI